MLSKNSHHKRTAVGEMKIEAVLHLKLNLKRFCIYFAKAHASMREWMRRRQKVEPRWVRRSIRCDKMRMAIHPSLLNNYFLNLTPI